MIFFGVLTLFCLVNGGAGRAHQHEDARAQSATKKFAAEDDDRRAGNITTRERFTIHNRAWINPYNLCTMLKVQAGEACFIHKRNIKEALQEGK
jgi:hypothetical protein